MARRPPTRTDVVQVSSFSDGDPNHVPAHPGYQPSNPDTYMRKLATKWMETHGGGVVPGTIYLLDKLPAGYVLYERRRPANPTHVDKFLFGHPNHQVYDSSLRFFPHFCFLMKHAAESTCLCDICSGKKPSSNRGRASKTEQTEEETPPTPTMRDEGEPDDDQPSYFTCLLELLRKEGSLVRAWQEPLNMDWRSTRDSAAEHIRHIANQPSFVPRVGELVLWCHTIKGEIRRHPQTKEFRFFDPESGRFGKHPQWIGGVISQAPSPDQPIDLNDLLRQGKKQKAVTYSGFRVECLPNPNDKEKSLSMRYSHVPMHHIRPMAFRNEIMLGISPIDWHPTIQNCMTAMGTIAQVERYSFHGTWPDANVKSKGCAYGAETYYIGDVVRLLHKGATMVTDILHITDFVFKFKGFHPDHHERVTSHSVSQIHADFHGFGYTLDIKRSRSGVRINPMEENNGLPQWVYGYGPWYHIFEPDRPMTIACVGVLGRLFEAIAVQTWLPDTNIPSLMQAGRESLVEARDFALQWDERLKNPPKPFRICEDRVECLDIISFNGRAVNCFEDPYIPILWRRVMAEIDKIPWKRDTEPPEEHEYRAIPWGEAGDEDQVEKGVLNHVVRGLVHGREEDGDGNEGGYGDGNEGGYGDGNERGYNDRDRAGAGDRDGNQATDERNPNSEEGYDSESPTPTTSNKRMKLLDGKYKSTSPSPSSTEAEAQAKLLAKMKARLGGLDHDY